MQRRAYVPGVAALLAALTVGVTGLTGCSAGSGPDGSATDSKAGDAANADAQPGKYRTLLEPCGSIQRATLKDLLPGVALLPEDQRERAYRGTAAVTYDTDRRAGCSWKTDGPDASHQLTLDFERVVSYDPAVSDDDRAQQVYAGKEAAAGLPAGPPAAAGGAQTPQSPAGNATTVTPTPTATATPTPNATGTIAAPEGLQPRVLSGLADAAFLDDVLTRAGSTAQRRIVSVVFRTSNVIVTIRYGEQPARITDVPDSKELQEKAQGLARYLAERFEE
ncbi:DUF3558 domain-containing protein [Streptomyces ficellus]|uniref:DUF3558 domain-containing protein n=1 Tax=Streptomyces ficellus TaxID=1977088 RepID=A0ABT7Z836_9ACTN|nr:DUF3558 domain-containing protein [Streptomyces ficellus]MDN3295606.1 DUF3558 domain-containing protein [Streptomyces ficellus]